MNDNKFNLKCKKIFAISLTLIGLFGFINGYYETLVWNIFVYYSCALGFYLFLFADVDKLIYKKGIIIVAGIILFSLVVPIIHTIFKTPSFENNIIPIAMAIVGIIILVLGTVLALLYFSFEKFKKYKYSLPIVLSFYIIGLLIINIIPIIYNVNINYIWWFYLNFIL